MFNLTSHISFDLPAHIQDFPIRSQMMAKWEILSLMSIWYGAVNFKFLWNVLLSTTVCSLQIIKEHWTSIVKPYCCKWTLPTVENYSVDHNSDSNQKFQKQYCNIMVNMTGEYDRNMTELQVIIHHAKEKVTVMKYTTINQHVCHFVDKKTFSKFQLKNLNR